ncbi:phage protease [Shewanella sp. KCT]|uniref:phage protease n=1 Tax=Shewanella sp. KCT TaxID=2569535 RepID=UPI0011845440|nr:phage protease [Shewanella sp. KCT]TVP15760.1 hypothetical protein AYI87_04660 [Shewanella sp. KCT]
MNQPHNQLFSTTALSEQTSDTPSRIKLLPIERRFTATDGRQFLLESPEEVVANSIRQSVEMSIDYEHSLMSDSTEPKPAAGWITNLRAESDGIYGDVKWTPKAQEMVKNKEYRYLSPVLSFEKHEGEVLAIRRIVNVALTNNPALEMMAFCHDQSLKNSLETVGIKEIASLLNVDANSSQELITALKAHQKTEALAACKADVEKVIIEFVFPASCRSELLVLRESLGKEHFSSLSQKLSDGGFGWAHLKGKTQTERLAANGRLPNSQYHYGLTEREIQACSLTGVKPEDFIKTKELNNDY